MGGITGVHHLNCPHVTRMHLGRRWLQLGHDILQEGDPVDLFLARIGLATALALQGRVDLARPYIAEVLAPLPSTTSERLLQIGEDWSGSLRPCGGATSVIWSSRCTDSSLEPWTSLGRSTWS